ncbi:MAG: hypothetical protein ACFFBU_05180, partial [Promethearchaeota archaeon]
EPPEVSMAEAIEEEEIETELQSKISQLNTEIEQTKQKNQELSNQVSELLNQVDEINSKKNEFENQIASLTEELNQANTDNAQFREKIIQLEDEIKQRTKQIKELDNKLSESENQASTLEKEFKEQEKLSKSREEQLLSQLEAMAEQIGKLRGVVKKRDEELVTLQKDILTKKGIAQDARTEADKLRTVGIVQREAVQDTTVLRRRVNDLEVELDHLKKALEKDPKYRIYLLVRETGQRTLEELSKILGVGVFEARRRVQELVRSGLLELKDDKAKLARRR